MPIQDASSNVLMLITHQVYLICHEEELEFQLPEIFHNDLWKPTFELAGVPGELQTDENVERFYYILEKVTYLEEYSKEDINDIAAEALEFLADVTRSHLKLV